MQYEEYWKINHNVPILIETKQNLMEAVKKMQARQRVKRELNDKSLLKDELLNQEKEWWE